MPLRVLFVDMNSYFASVEQQYRPELRGKPVVVAALDAETTCCIAVSPEAKQLGVQRGMPVWQARKHRSLTVAIARTALYVQVHHQIVEAVESCLPVHTVDSIDELSCRLGAGQREPAQARELAGSVKQAIRQRAGDYLKCSIGLAPNRFLAKVATDLQKPDGLIVIETRDLPHVLYSLKLDDLPGIGPNMLSRLNRAGIATVEQLCQQPESRMQSLWRGVVGRRWWHWLRGDDVSERPTRRTTVGHSHVLPPEFRTDAGAHAVLMRLIQKAAVRLRRLRHWARRMEIELSYLAREKQWSRSAPLGLCQDTLTMIETFRSLWEARPRGLRPTHVSVSLSDLVPETAVSAPLFPIDQRRVNLARAMDLLNDHFGANTVHFGGMHTTRNAAPTRIAFTSIPDERDD